MSLLREATRCLQTIKDKGERLNAFVSLKSESAIHQAANDAQLRKTKGKALSPLDGLCFAVKDNFCTYDLPTTCSSRMLDGFSPNYDATVVQNLRRSGAIIIGKTNMDEFGMGSHSTYSHYGNVENPLDENIPRSAGGSSGGSAAAVASGMCFGALGSDTGGSVRLPASYCGILGFKPSYGLLSRKGMIAYAHSLDTVGILSRKASDAKMIFDAINVGHDPADPTSLSQNTRERINFQVHQFRESRGGLNRRWRIGIPLEYNVAEMSEEMIDTWKSILTKLVNQGHEIIPIHLRSTKDALLAYYTLAPSEASSNLAKYDGVRYGFRPKTLEKFVPESRDASPSETFVRSRGLGFGNEVQRRILLGTYALSSEAFDNYFIQAQRIRQMVRDDFDRAFALSNPLTVEHGETNLEEMMKVDVLLSPVSVTTAPTLDSVGTGKSYLSAYINDAFTVPASMAGIPAISVPIGVDHSMPPTAVQVLGQFGDDDSVLDMAYLLENM